MNKLKLVTCVFLSGGFLTGCIGIPAISFEENGRSAVDEAVDEEEGLYPYPAPAAYPPAVFPERRLGRYQRRSNSLETKRRSLRITAQRPRR